MNYLELPKLSVDPDDYVGKAPVMSGQLITESTVVTNGGVPVVVYLTLGEDLSAVRGAFERIRYIDDYRTAGLKTNSRTIGYLPRVALRRDFCTATSLANESPADHTAAVSAARIAAFHYAQHNPAGYATHLAAAQEKIKPEWRLFDTPFTSGIINDNNPLKYHFDSGNIKGVWSAMFGFKRHIQGGYLHLPEYGVALEIADNSLSLFNGQGLIHGVTPITKTAPDAHRFTCVFYSLQAMWRCEGIDDELKRIQRVRSERERKRAAGIVPTPKKKGAK